MDHPRHVSEPNELGLGYYCAVIKKLFCKHWSKRTLFPSLQCHLWLNKICTSTPEVYSQQCTLVQTQTVRSFFCSDKMMTWSVCICIGLQYHITWYDIILAWGITYIQCSIAVDLRQCLFSHSVGQAHVMHPHRHHDHLMFLCRYSSM